MIRRSRPTGIFDTCARIAAGRLQKEASGGLFGQLRQICQSHQLDGCSAIPAVPMNAMPSQSCPTRQGDAIDEGPGVLASARYESA